MKKDNNQLVLKRTSAKKPQLETFSIFDTLISRSTITIESIYAQVATEMMTYYSNPFPQVLIENYVEIRNTTETNMRKRRASFLDQEQIQTELTLQQVLQAIQAAYNLSDEQTNFLYTVELNIEIEMVKPNRKKIDYLFSEQAQGNEIVLLDDTILPEPYIKKMLKQADQRLQTLPLYLSSELGYQKKTGTLFNYVAKQLQVAKRYSKWIHYGPDEVSDNQVPKSLGIQVFRNERPSYLDNEIWYPQQADWRLEGMAYRLAGGMQQQRWHYLAQSKNTFSQAKYYAYAYASPLLVPYVNWLLKDAQKKGLQTLYFVMNDNYYLAAIAQTIVDLKDYPIKIKKLHGAVSLLRVASFLNVADDAMDLTEMFRNIHSFSDIVFASQLEEQDLVEMFPDFKHYQKKPDLTDEEIKSACDEIMHSSIYRQKLREIATLDKFEMVRNYLKQTLNIEEKFALVAFDNQMQISKIYERLISDAVTLDALPLFYFMQNLTDENAKNLSFLNSTQNILDYENLLATSPFRPITEFIYSDTGEIEPVFVPRRNSTYKIMDKVLKKFIDDYLRLNPDETFDRFTSEMTLTYYFKHPYDQFIINVFAKMQNNLGKYGVYQPFARKFTARLIKSHTMAQLKQKTSNLMVSVYRGNAEARAAFAELCVREGKSTPVFPSNSSHFPEYSLNEFIRIRPVPFEIVLLEDQGAYSDMAQDSIDEYTQQLKKGEIIKVLGIEWGSGADMHLVTKYGYLSASKKLVSPLRNDITKYYYQKDIHQIVTKSKKYYYNSVDFTPSNRTTQQTNIGEVIDITGIAWTSGGTPRFKTQLGYLTTNKYDVSTNKMLIMLGGLLHGHHN